MHIPAKIKHLVFTTLLVLASINIVRTAYDILKSSSRLDDLSEEINGLETDKNKLSEDLEFMKTTDYVEERARNDLNMVKPGENLVVMVDKNGNASPEYTPEDVLPASTARVYKEDSKQSNIYLWYRLFFDK